MKINYFTPIHNYKNNSNNYTNKSQYNKTNTISFNANKSYMEKSLDELEAEFNKRIKPLMVDSQNLYIETCKIGYNIQESVNYFSKQETELFRKKLELSNQYSNKKLSEPIIMLNKKADNLEINIKTYENIKDLSKKDLYKDNEQLINLINSSQKLFNDTDDTIKLQNYQKFQNDVFKNLEENLQKQSLKNIAPEIHKNIEKITNIKDDAIFYLFINPYTNGQKIEKSIQEIKKIPKSELYKALKYIEHEHDNIQSVERSKDNYYRYKQEMQKFINNNKDINKIIPKKEDLKSIYELLNEKIEYYTNEGINKIEKYYNEKLIKSENKLNFQKINTQIESQNTAINNMYKVIDSIKLDFYKSSYEQYKNRD